MVAVVVMSKREFDQLETLLGVQSGRLRVADACVLLDRSRRQVFRLLRGMREAGAIGLVSKRRGKPSNRRLPDAVRQLAVALVREHYRDFGPSFAAEQLAEGLWLDRRHRLPLPHQPRRRRECLGELVQLDLHRPVSAGDDLDEVLAWREARTVTANLVLHYDRMMLLLEPTALPRDLVRKTVEVVNYPDGRFAVRHAGAGLAFRVFDKIGTVASGAMVENKRLGEVLAHVRAQQAAYPDHRGGVRWAASAL